MAHFAVRLRAQLDRDRVSDEDGILSFDPGLDRTGTIHLLDDPRRPLFEARAAYPSLDLPPGDIAVAVGPTYGLVFDVPEGCEPDDFWVAVAPADEAFYDRAQRGQLRAAPEHPQAGAPWVRLPSLPSDSPDGTWLLVLTSADGLWSASAWVPAQPGLLPDPVVLALEATCSIQGRVTTAGEPVPPGVVVEARSLDPHADLFGRGGEVSTTAGGSYVLGGLLPGSYRISVRNCLHGDATRDVVLDARKVPLDLPLEHKAGGPVAGSVEFEPGLSAAESFVSLTREGTDSFLALDLEPDDEAPNRYRFRWSHVPHGRYRLTVHAGAVRESMQGWVSPPQEGLAVRVEAP